MKYNNQLMELKIHELSFAVKKLKIHENINNHAMSEFSKSFKNFIEDVQDPQSKHKLKQIAGLAGENEKRMTKTAKKAKQQGQYRKKRNKVQQEHQEVEIPPEIPSKSVPQEYKGLYRKIAKETHPDKTKDDKSKNKILQEVNNAIFKEDYFKLIEYALLLGIEIPDEVPLETKKIDEKIAIANQKIQQITKSVAWEWYHLDKQSDKESMIEGYATYLLNNV
jgi:hypothetical protein